MDIIKLNNLDDWKKRVEFQINQLFKKQLNIIIGTRQDTRIQNEINKLRIVRESILFEIDNINNTGNKINNGNSKEPS